MTDVVQLVSIVVSASLLVTIIELVRRRRLSEEYLAHLDRVCRRAFRALAVAECAGSCSICAGRPLPAAVLLLVLTFFVVIVSLYFSVVVSRHRQDIEKLVEEVALLDEQVRRLRSSALILPADAVLRPPDIENHIEQ